MSFGRGVHGSIALPLICRIVALPATPENFPWVLGNQLVYPRSGGTTMPNTLGLPLGEAVDFGWKALKTRAGFLVGVTLAAWGIPAVIGWAGDVAFDNGIQEFGIAIIEGAVAATFCLGLARIFLRTRDGEKAIFENLFDVLPRLHVYIGAVIVAFVAVTMGLVLFIVPGIIFLIRLWFVAFVIVDEAVGPLEALQRSWDITRGYALDLFLLFIVLCGLNILGFICLGVGLLITFPISGLALASTYRTLRARAAGASVSPDREVVQP
jgi:hypothetical protein